MENPIKMDDLGVPLFLETPIFIVMFMVICDCFMVNSFAFLILFLQTTFEWGLVSVMARNEPLDDMERLAIW